MPIKRTDFDPDHAIKLYETGLSGPAVAAAMGTHIRYVYETLAERGLSRPNGWAQTRLFADRANHPRYRQDIPSQTVAERYVTGESIKRIGKSLGVSQALITRCLHEQGITIRSGAKTLEVFARTRAKDGTALPARMHVVGWGEDLLRQWLVERGHSPDPQLAVGTKNIDLALHPIAVEILLTSSAPVGVPEYRTRLKELANRGWRVCYVLISRRTRVLIPTVADKVIALAEQVRANPALPTKHWVIRGCGEVAATFRTHAHDCTLIPPSKHCPHHARGYARRPH